MSARPTDVLNEIKEAVGAQAAAFEAFKTENGGRIEDVGKGVADLRDRVEELESRRASPGKAGDPLRPAKAWSTFETAHGPVHVLPHDVKMSDVVRPAKTPEVSLERWLAATIAGERCQDKAALDFARDKKQMTTATTGVLIPAEYQSTWIDMIRAASVLNACGMRTVTMDGKTQVHSAVTADPLAAWHSEGGSINAANPTFAARTLTAKTLVTRCQGSVELAQDSPDFGRQLANVMTKSMAAEIDRVGLVGTGTPPEPAGILNTASVGNVGSFGTPGDYVKLLAAVQTLLEANVPLEVATANVIMSPRTWAKYEGLVTGLSSDKSQLARPRALANTAFRVTSAVPNDLPQGASPPGAESAVFLGDFRDLLLGVRAESSVEVLKLTTFATNLLLEFVGYTRVDFLVTRPASFCIGSGVTN